MDKNKNFRTMEKNFENTPKCKKMLKSVIKQK